MRCYPCYHTSVSEFWMLAKVTIGKLQSKLNILYLILSKRIKHTEKLKLVLTKRCSHRHLHTAMVAYVTSEHPR